MQLVRSGFGHHVHIYATDRHGGGRVVSYNLKLIEGIVIGVELRVTAIGSWPVQIQAVVTIDLLGLRAPMNLHGRLLITVVASHVERAGRDAGHLRDGGPGIPSTWNVLQQVLVEGRRGLIVLQIDDGLSFNLYYVCDFSHLQFCIYCGGESGGENDPCFVKTLKPLGCDGNLVSAGGQQVKQVRAVCSSGCAAFRHKRRAFYCNRGAWDCSSRSIRDDSRDFACYCHLRVTRTWYEPQPHYESDENEYR